MKTDLTFPFYAKAALVCIGLFAFVSMLAIGQGIIVPLIYSTIVAILLSPVVNFLVRNKMNRILAITITVMLLILVAISATILLSNQIIQFSDSLPALAKNFQQLLDQSIAWISETFGVTIGNVNLWIDEQSAGLVDEANSKMGQTLINTGSSLILIILIPIYIFMLLFYQPLLIQFIHKLFSADNQTNVNEVVTNTKKIIQSYLVGLMLEALIVAVLYSIALLILGIEYAILLAVIGALLNLIPYLGAIIAASLPMIIALATKSPTYALLVLASYILIQLIDNNYIIPKVVASRVRINAFISIIVVIAFGSLWGIPGMFLAIPLTAILKVIFDHIEGLKPWGYLLGDTMPGVTKILFKKSKQHKTKEIEPG